MMRTFRISCPLLLSSVLAAQGIATLPVNGFISEPSSGLRATVWGSYDPAPGSRSLDLCCEVLSGDVAAVALEDPTARRIVDLRNTSNPGRPSFKALTGLTQIEERFSLGEALRLSVTDSSGAPVAVQSRLGIAGVRRFAIDDALTTGEGTGYGTGQFDVSVRRSTEAPPVQADVYRWTPAGLAERIMKLERDGSGGFAGSRTIEKLEDLINYVVRFIEADGTEAIVRLRAASRPLAGLGRLPGEPGLGKAMFRGLDFIESSDLDTLVTKRAPPASTRPRR